MSIKIALVGNPNCGKTTMFNAMTGANQYVGNWPGVTVEKKEGKLRGYPDAVVTDLPGIYSLSPYTLEEVVSRNYIIDEHPDVIVNLVDATNLERNLYLTTQVMEMGIPVVIALNMMDVVKKNGDKIDAVKMSNELGCPVVEVSALKGTGLKELFDKAVEVGNAKTYSGHQHKFAPAVEEALGKIEGLLEGKVPQAQLRWYAVKLFERDDKVQAKFDAAIVNSVGEITSACETALDDDSESIITNERYEYITSIIGKIYKKARQGMSVSDKIDQIVTNRILALPIFVVMMTLVYYIAVSSLGTIVTDWTNDTLFGEWIQPAVGTFLENAGAADWVVSLVVDGIIVVIVSCIILKKTRMFSGEPAPFVMELPQYHVPSLKGVLLHVWERVWAFLKKAGTILFVCCAVMWFLGSFGIQDGVFGLVDTDYCFLATIGGAIAWIFAPLGFGTWQAVASSLSGFVAKEGIVSTMGVLSGLGEIEEYAPDMHAQFAAFFPTSLSAISFLLFNLFDSPCLAAISTTAKEIGSRKFFWFAILFQNVMAYAISLMVYQLVGLALGEVQFGAATVAAAVVLVLILYFLFRPDPAKQLQRRAAAANA